MGSFARVIKVRILNQFYKRNFSRYLVARMLRAFLLLCYKEALVFAALFGFLPVSGRFRWHALGLIKGRSGSRVQILFPYRITSIASTRFFGFGALAAQSSVINHDQSLTCPPLGVFQFSKAFAVGGVDAVFCDGLAIHNDFFLPAEHELPGEVIGVLRQHKYCGEVSIALAKRPMRVPKAVSMLGQCSHNYAHFLTEVLPKLPLMDRSNLELDTPILLDFGLHKNILESVHLLNRNSREVILVDRWRPVLTESLAVVSAPAYERYLSERIVPKTPLAHRNVFSHDALQILRSSVFEALNIDISSSPSHVFLGRSGAINNLRSLENSFEIEGTLRDLGFSILVPQNVSFVEQVKCCSNAQLIVAPVGAALANMIFAPAGCRIIALAPYYKGADYSFFLQLACSLGHDLSYVLGAQTGRHQDVMHDNFFISLDDLYASLK